MGLTVALGEIIFANLNYTEEKIKIGRKTWVIYANEKESKSAYSEAWSHYQDSRVSQSKRHRAGHPGLLP